MRWLSAQLTACGRPDDCLVKKLSAGEGRLGHSYGFSECTKLGHLPVKIGRHVQKKTDSHFAQLFHVKPLTPHCLLIMSPQSVSRFGPA